MQILHCTLIHVNTIIIAHQSDQSTESCFTANVKPSYQFSCLHLELHLTATVMLDVDI